MRSKILFKCGISINIISLMVIVLYIILEAPIIVICSPIIFIVMGIFVMIMGWKKVIVTKEYIKFLEKTISLNNILFIIVDYPLIEIKINQSKNNRYRIDYNLDLITKLEKYLDENKIKYINKCDNNMFFQNFYKKRIQKEDVHSIFEAKKIIYLILKSGKVYKFKNN